MSKPLTTEQIFRKCFGPSPLRVLDYNEIEHRLIARAARRFCRMERKQIINRMLKASGKITRDEVTACRKTTGKGT
ncbi:MAG: hypothetical protein WC455_17055 [Dehalococcoidia bacterium]|jgi:hypothetical protein